MKEGKWRVFVHGVEWRGGDERRGEERELLVIS